MTNSSWKWYTTTFKPSKARTYTWMTPPVDYLIEEAFHIPSQYRKIVDQFNLVGSLTSTRTFLFACDELLNTLEDTDAEAFESVDKMVKHVLIYHGSVMYRNLLQTADPEEIPYRIWVHFNRDCDWYSVTRPTFRDMPTDVMDRFIEEEMESRMRTCRFDQISDMFEARTDRYALPPMMLEGILSN